MYKLIFQARICKHSRVLESPFTHAPIDCSFPTSDRGTSAHPVKRVVRPLLLSVMFHMLSPCLIKTRRPALSITIYVVIFRKKLPVKRIRV